MSTVIARRVTHDGVAVCLWDDGALTGALGPRLRGLPMGGRASAIEMRAGWLLMGDVGIYDAGELGRLYRAALWAAKRDGLPGAMRARFAEPGLPELVWEVESADSRGTTTERRCTLPRVVWPGSYTIIDEVNRKPRYGLWRLVYGTTIGAVSRGALEIECRFSTLKELFIHLRTQRDLLSGGVS